jgi:hypothetical protein
VISGQKFAEMIAKDDKIKSVRIIK